MTLRQWHLAGLLAATLLCCGTSDADSERAPMDTSAVPDVEVAAVIGELECVAPCVFAFGPNWGDVQRVTFRNVGDASAIVNSLRIEGLRSVEFGGAISETSPPLTLEPSDELSVELLWQGRSEDCDTDGTGELVVGVDGHTESDDPRPGRARGAGGDRCSAVEHRVCGAIDRQHVWLNARNPKRGRRPALHFERRLHRRDPRARVREPTGTVDAVLCSVRMNRRSTGFSTSPDDELGGRVHDVTSVLLDELPGAGRVGNDPRRCCDQPGRLSASRRLRQAPGCPDPSRARWQIR